MYHNVIVGFFIFYIGILASLVYSKTDSEDVSALNVLFSSLNSPSKLKGWKSSGGDPCDQSWDGVTCSGSSVTEIKLSDMGLSGSLGYQLGNLKSLTHFDMSSNNLKDSIPFQLPPNVQHLDLSRNSLTGNVPYSISQMTNLNYLNLGHNNLDGQVNDISQKTKLEFVDLSFNRLSGNLPQSFQSLKKLKTLYLQNNQLTGSINVLARLPLDDLNVENNKFTGWVPESLEEIAKTGGNSWSSGPAPPPPPGTPAIPKRHKPSTAEGQGNSVIIGVVIAASVLVGLGIVVVVIVVCVRKKKSSRSSHFVDEEKSTQYKSPLATQELATQESSNDQLVGMRKDYKENTSFSSDVSVDIKPFQKSSSIVLNDKLANRVESFRDNAFANRLKSQRSTTTRATPYSLADLQTATANFAKERLLGAGTIGGVYRAKYPDGKVLAVKKIETSPPRPEDFSALISIISRIHHTNIAELLGYCTEQGQNMLIYEYFRNGSLHEFLHLSHDFSKPLTWNTRVRIALGVARAIEYLHGSSPSLVHKNIKSSNILLDLDLNPYLSDYGLANFHERIGENHGAGYNAPECTKVSAYTVKTDIYSFGVVMLEIMTGRMAYDIKKPNFEQCLAQWAAPQLHNIDALEEMADPALHGLYPPKSLSKFADIIAICVQPEPEYRPPISEVVESLVRLVQSSAIHMKEDLQTSRRLTNY